jgi:hypothetical protein
MSEEAEGHAKICVERDDWKARAEAAEARLREAGETIRRRATELVQVREVLQECADTMAFAYIFVASKENIKKPEGSVLYKAALAKARQALAQPAPVAEAELKPGDWGDDATKWAEAFCRTYPGAMDEGTMIGWFANAIEIACDKRALAAACKAEEEEEKDDG